MPHVPARPLAPRATRGEARLHVRVEQDLSRRRVDRDRLAGAEAAACDDVLVVEVHDARLRGRHDVPVVGDLPAQGPQARAVEVGARDDSIRERDGRRAVPRLDQPCVEVVERAERLGQVALRRVGDQHRERVERVAPRAHEELERLVEARRVAALVREDREEAGDAVAPDRRGELGLARAHRVAVSPERVDLAVVREKVERLGERPARERVRGVALVEDGDARRVVGVLEVRIESLELRAGQERLVDQGPVRERHHPEALEPLGSRAARRDAAREVEPPFPLVGVDARGRRQERVADGGARRLGPAAEPSRAHGNVAPAREGQPLFGERPLDDLRRLRLAPTREEERPDSDRRAFGQREAALCRVATEKGLGDAGQDAGAVARPVAARGAAVRDAREAAEGEAQDAVRRLAGMRHEADAARVVLAVGISTRVDPVRPAPRASLGHPRSFPDS